MASLIPLSQLLEQHADLGTGLYDPTGSVVYASGGEQVGTVRGALAEPGGRLRYLIVDAGGWFSTKQVLVPVGLARIEDTAVYFDSLTREQVRSMSAYEAGQDYGDEAQAADVRVLRGTDSAVGVQASDADDALFQTPQRLQLLEERLQVSKDRYVTGHVEVGKRIVSRTEELRVPLRREQIVIERLPIPEARAVALELSPGAAMEVIRADLAAERASVFKRTYVVEEVEVGKRVTTDNRIFTDTVGREVLEVTQTGDVTLHGDGLDTNALDRDQGERR